MQINVKINNDIQPQIYLITKSDKVINGVCYCCEYVNGSPCSPNHTDIQWCTSSEIKNMDKNLFIKDFHDELINFAEILEK